MFARAVLMTSASALCLQSLFAMGCMMLKWKRPRIPRAVRSSYVAICSALVMVVLGLLFNVLRNPKVVQYFVRARVGVTTACRQCV